MAEPQGLDVFLSRILALDKAVPGAPLVLLFLFFGLCFLGLCAAVGLRLDR